MFHYKFQQTDLIIQINLIYYFIYYLITLYIIQIFYKLVNKTDKFKVSSDGIITVLKPLDFEVKNKYGVSY